MKTIFKSAVIICALATINSCSAPAYVEKDNAINFSNYKTFMWVDTKASEDDVSSRATSFADIGVRNAVNQELQQWGWKEVTDNPDVLICYDVLVERSVDTQSEPVYSQSYSRLYYNPYRRRWATIYFPPQFLGYQQYQVPVKEATVTISMIDARSDKKVWQGWTTERLGNAGISDLDVKKSVRNIFKESGNAAA
ncbi:MAG TPA: DUF4136 domain-containing protein [Chitinophagaceae bacterium]|nr:DUF4136 domain-containing protein [Chitinophagaceae bacterium]